MTTVDEITSPGEFDVRIADASATPWSDGCAGFVMAEIPRRTDNDPEMLREREELIDDIVSEGVRLLEPGGRFAAFVVPPSTYPWTDPGLEIREAFERHGLLPRPAVVWVTPESQWPQLEGPDVWLGPHDPPLRIMTVVILLGGKGSHARDGGPRERALRGLPHLFEISEDEWHRDGEDMWLPEQDTDSDDTVAAEAASRLVARHTYLNEAVVCLTGEVEAALAVLRRGRRCLLAVTEQGELETATQRLADEVRKRTDSSET